MVTGPWFGTVLPHVSYAVTAAVNGVFFATQFGGWDVNARDAASPGATVNGELSAELAPSVTVSLVVSAS